MKITGCDRCGRIAEPDEDTGYWACLELPVIGVEWDICPDCLEDLKKWKSTPPKRGRSVDKVSDKTLKTVDSG